MTSLPQASNLSPPGLGNAKVVKVRASNVLVNNSQVGTTLVVLLGPVNVDV